MAGQLEKVDGDRTTLAPLLATVRSPGCGEKLGYEYINSVSLAKLGAFLDPIGPPRPVTLRGHGHARWLHVEQASPSLCRRFGLITDLHPSRTFNSAQWHHRFLLKKKHPVVVWLI